MAAPPYSLQFTDTADAVLDDLETNKNLRAKAKKVQKALKLLAEVGPRHPGLETHKYGTIPGPSPTGLYQSYAENRTPRAWRIWWVFGPNDDEITIMDIGPHPD